MRLSVWGTVIIPKEKEQTATFLQTSPFQMLKSAPGADPGGPRGGQPLSTSRKKHEQER